MMINKILNYLPYDERVRFHDLSKISFKQRKANSKVLNFYSSVDNIGNFTPILGIQTILNDVFDVWCCHDENIDWKFINLNYERIIIGGAGLFHKSFTKFWEEFIRECKVPSIIWGVGGIFPKNKELIGNVDTNILKKALLKCDLINLRDALTANYVNLSNIHISPCPTIAFLDKINIKEDKKKSLLYSSHEELLNQKEKEDIKNILNQKVKYSYTDNIQYKYNGLNRIIRKYQRSTFVFTTRLHGAIIAYGLGIPYLAISFDYKINEFHRQYGNGFIIDDVKHLKDIDIERLTNESVNQKPSLLKVNEFGENVKNWIK